MKRMFVNWDATETKDVDILFTSKRSYRCINVDNWSNKRADKHFDPLLLCFIYKQKSSIDTIEIRNEEYLLSELECLFQIVRSNLKSFFLYNINYINNKEISTMIFPKLKVIKTCAGSFDLYYHLFKEAKNIEVKTILKPFIVDHKSITHLELTFCELSISDIEDILKNLGRNMTAISLNLIRFENNTEAYPMDLPKLKSISFYASMEEGPIVIANLFKFFICATNVEVVYTFN